jgi:hypothetical protein
MMDMEQRDETWQEACRMNFGVAMSPQYIHLVVRVGN